MNKKTRLILFVIGLCLLFLSWKGVDLILDYVIAPRAVAERSGWNIRFFNPVSENNREGFEAFIKSAKIVPLHPEFRSSTAYTIWSVSVTGPYQVHFSAEAVSSVAIDGRTILHARPRSQTGRIEEAWIDLRAGTHLVRLDLYNSNGGGTFSVGEMTPPLMWMKHLEGDLIAYPRLGSLDTWWYAMVAVRPIFYCSLAIVIAIFLSFLLPLAAMPTRKSVVVVLFLVFLPPMFIPSYSKREPYIGDMVHRQLERKNPAFVFIGNSMLWSRIDDELLSHLIGGRRVHSIVNFGGMSAFLYLSFKYLLLPAHVHPKRVFFFFRDTTLTQPKIFTTGSYIEGLLQKVCPQSDPVYEHLVHGKSSSMIDSLYARLKKIYPIQDNEIIVRDKLSQVALSFTIPGDERGEKRDRLRKAINERLSMQNNGTGKDNQGEPWGGGGENYDFKGMLAKSFLPRIITLAREHNVDIAFIRVQRRPQGKGIFTDSPKMKAYMKELATYLNRNNVAFYDFTGDPDLPLSMYAIGDHIAEPRKYTPFFVKRVRHLLQ